MALQFLYERAGADHANHTPSKWLWHVEELRPILQFAHEYNMQNVLKECDHYLTEKAQHNDGKRFFSDFERTVAWATLADQCHLSYLLAHAEMFMVKTADNTFWTSAAARQLNPGCLLRMLQAAQFHMNDWASVSANNARQTKEAATISSSLQHTDQHSCCRKAVMPLYLTSVAGVMAKRKQSTRFLNHEAACAQICRCQAAVCVLW